MKHLSMTMGVVLAVLPLLSGEPQTQPILRLETGMHSAPIKRFAVDGSGRVLATASDDKTLRLWDTATGDLLATVRPPIGPGYEGNLYTCAFSPDGRTLAVGGWTGQAWDGSCSIYLVDAASAQITRRITGLPIFNHLVYGPDGRLAVGLSTGGIKVFLADGTLAFSDSGYGNQVYGADFDRAGRLVTSCYDGFLRLYDRNGRRVTKVQVKGQPFSVRFSPDGTRLAVGFNDDRIRVEVRSGQDLSIQFRPDVKEATTVFPFVAWSADGQVLSAAGGQQIRIWPNGGRGGWTDHPVVSSGVMDLASLPGGRLLWAAGDPAWGILGGLTRSPSNADFRSMMLGLDPEGTRVAFNYKSDGLVGDSASVASFDVNERAIRPGYPPGVQFPRTAAPGVVLTDWVNNPGPKLGQQPLAIRDFETSRCVALGPQGSILLGADWYLYAFDAKGNPRWEAPAPGSTWAVNVNRDGTLGVAAFGDGTIRWYRMEDGKELLAFFPHNDGKRWVAWTPLGYYDASPGGEDLIGWHVNRDKDQVADFFPASRFRAQFYRPDIVGQVLKVRDEDAAITRANAGRRTDLVMQEQALPPVVTILDPKGGTRIDGASATIRASVRTPKGRTTDVVWATVDGRRVDTRGLRPQQEQGNDQVYAVEVSLPDKDCLVSVFAQSGTLVSEPAMVKLLRGPAPIPSPLPASSPGDRPEPNPGRPPASAFVIQPKLYLLSIGVGAYRRADLSLDFPAKDARDLAAAFVAQKGGFYRDVEVKLLTDGEATKEAVLDGLEWLERQVTSKDVAVVFLAGHGLNDTGGQYYFLPSNADPDRIKRTMVADSDVRSTLAKLPGKVLLFLDTCHSGNILGGVKQRGGMDLNGFINELSSAESGVVVFSASTGRQSSQESRDWGNGAFTKAVVEGLSGKADFQHTGRVTLNMLDLYISERVKALTKGSQSPTTAKPNTIQDFPIAVVR